ncbi:MAG: homoserine dehydrogenase [Tenuifilaceae bacterium]
METLEITNKQIEKVKSSYNETTQVIGLFGFGTVGSGLYHVLENSPTTKARIKKVCIKNAFKERSLNSKLFTTNPDEILDDSEINLVVELIDNADDAYRIVKAALLQGKSVVSGNKTMLAHHLEELIDIQKKTGTALLYDASACGSIPVIRNLEEYYDNDLLLSIRGILNGSSNFILSRIFQHNDNYNLALKKAQDLGFAESDPSFDVMGFDALFKLVILAVHGFGTYVHPKDAFNYGIHNLSAHDIRYAKEKGLKIKLVATLTKLGKNCLTLFVMPTFVSSDDYIYNVEEEYNGVVIEGAFYEKQFMFGKGAGGHPTGSAVLSDITARFHDYRYEYKKRKYFNCPEYSTDVVLEVFIRYHDIVDLTVFGIEEIIEKYNGRDHRWVIAKVKLSSLLKVKELIPKLNLFIAFTGKLEYNE